MPLRARGTEQEATLVFPHCIQEPLPSKRRGKPTCPSPEMRGLGGRRRHASAGVTRDLGGVRPSPRGKAITPMQAPSKSAWKMDQEMAVSSSHGHLVDAVHVWWARRWGVKNFGMAGPWSQPPRASDATADRGSSPRVEGRSAVSSDGGDEARAVDPPSYGGSGAKVGVGAACPSAQSPDSTGHQRAANEPTTQSWARLHANPEIEQWTLRAPMPTLLPAFPRSRFQSSIYAEPIAKLSRSYREAPTLG